MNTTQTPRATTPTAAYLMLALGLLLTVALALLVTHGLTTAFAELSDRMAQAGL